MRSLIIDDDCISRTVLRAALEDHGPCTEATTGLEGVQLFTAALQERNPFDLIVSDVLMAGMDGHQTINALREAERTASPKAAGNTPILIMTTIRHFVDMHRLKHSSSPVEFVSKPLDRNELQQALHKLHLP